MKAFLLLISAHVLWATSEELSGPELVDFLRTNKPLWMAKPNKLSLKSSASEGERYSVMDVKFVEIPEGTPVLEPEITKIHKIPEGSSILDSKTGKMLVKEEIPDSFDSREKWPECYSIGVIRDQSNCGSCWAVAAAEVASDRMCINPPHYPMMLSGEDILSCCGRNCYPQEACRGGWPIAAMNWWVTNGIVTGTEYTDHQGCRPYSIPPCGYHNGTFRACPQLFAAPKCSPQCQEGYPRNYTQDKYFAKKAYHVPGDVTTIQREILEHGPVEAAFTVYEDFRHYQSGIYHHTWGPLVGGHAVKIIGWGVQGRIPYWLVVNSWGMGWGEKGLFRILRGNNECGFEAAIVAALPRS